jgi:hypothetical protein
MKDMKIIETLKKKEQDYSLFSAAADAGITMDQMDALITAQQGEEDAVYMYEQLAEVVRDEADREAFLRLAGDEKRHSDVFRKYTCMDVKANPAKGIFVPLMYRVLGKKKVYPIIAKGEYDAAEKYKHIIDDFPEVVEVMNDEVHHGDAVKGLL